MSDAVRRESRPEARSGAYQPLFLLGRGGMGSVYLARALGAAGFERLVVLKRLNPHLWDQPEAVRRFVDEARVAARVHHANVIGTHHVGRDEDGPFLVLDYVEGGSLDNLLEQSLLRSERIPPSIVLRIALDALAGLQAVHVAQDAAGRPLNILHRDVSLQNVLVGRDGVARIADFGIAKSAMGSVSTDKSYVVGKLLYMPPEYLYREAPAPTLDVYSLGITVWLALSGRELWPDCSEAQLLKHVVEDDVPRLSTVMSIAPEIDEIVARAVQRSPMLRYASARAMAADIERLGRSGGCVATHAEVSDFVSQLLGQELANRRELLARALSDAESTVEFESASEISAVHQPNLARRAVVSEFAGNVGDGARPRSTPRRASIPDAENVVSARSSVGEARALAIAPEPEPVVHSDSERPTGHVPRVRFTRRTQAIAIGLVVVAGVAVAAVLRRSPPAASDAPHEAASAASIRASEPGATEGATARNAPPVLVVPVAQPVATALAPASSQTESSLDPKESHARTAASSKRKPSAVPAAQDSTSVRRSGEAASNPQSEIGKNPYR